ncbi:MAG TPA: hypothetical protein DDX71_01730 [Ruminococcus sp.]|nr:hypothetical protein [Ruminococcus sp.]
MRIPFYYSIRVKCAIIIAYSVWFVKQRDVQRSGRLYNFEPATLYSIFITPVMIVFACIFV